MTDRKTLWIFTGLTLLFLLLTPLTFIVSVEIARTVKDPDIVELIGVFAMLVMMALFVICGAVTLVLWHHRHM